MDSGKIVCYNINMMKINEYFKQHFLTAGNSYDNFLFQKCPYQLVEEAEKSLKSSGENVKSYQIKINRETEAALANIFSKCDNELQETLVARDYINSLFMLQIIDDKNQKSILQEIVVAIESGDFEKFKQFHVYAPLIFDIDKASRSKNRKLELNIFLVDTQNVALQKAINNFLSARLPFSIKIFTTNAVLPCHYDQSYTVVQCPHDFMLVNIDNFITYEDEEERE